MELNGAALNVNKPCMTSRKTALRKISRGLSWSGVENLQKNVAPEPFPRHGKDYGFVNNRQTRTWLQMLLENGCLIQK